MEYNESDAAHSKRHAPTGQWKTPATIDYQPLSSAGTSQQIMAESVSEHYPLAAASSNGANFLGEGRSIVSTGTQFTSQTTPVSAAGGVPFANVKISRALVTTIHTSPASSAPGSPACLRASPGGHSGHDVIATSPSTWRASAAAPSGATAQGTFDETAVGPPIARTSSAGTLSGRPVLSISARRPRTGTPVLTAHSPLCSPVLMGSGPVSGAGAGSPKGWHTAGSAGSPSLGAGMKRKSSNNLATLSASPRHSNRPSPVVTGAIGVSGLVLPLDSLHGLGPSASSGTGASAVSGTRSNGLGSLSGRGRGALMGEGRGMDLGVAPALGVPPLVLSGVNGMPDFNLIDSTGDDDNDDDDLLGDSLGMVHGIDEAAAGVDVNSKRLAVGRGMSVATGSPALRALAMPSAVVGSSSAHAVTAAALESIHGRSPHHGPSHGPSPRIMGMGASGPSGRSPMLSASIATIMSNAALTDHVVAAALGAMPGEQSQLSASSSAAAAQMASSRRFTTGFRRSRTDLAGMEAAERSGSSLGPDGVPLRSPKNSPKITGMGMARQSQRFSELGLSAVPSAEASMEDGESKIGGIGNSSVGTAASRKKAAMFAANNAAIGGKFPAVIAAVAASVAVATSSQSGKGASREAVFAAATAAASAAIGRGGDRERGQDAAESLTPGSAPGMSTLFTNDNGSGVHQFSQGMGGRISSAVALKDFVFGGGSSEDEGEESTLRARERRVERNRESARVRRQKKRERVDVLEADIARLSALFDKLNCHRWGLWREQVCFPATRVGPGSIAAHRMSGTGRGKGNAGGGVKGKSRGAHREGGDVGGSGHVSDDSAGSLGSSSRTFAKNVLSASNVSSKSVTGDDASSMVSNHSSGTTVTRGSHGVANTHATRASRRSTQTSIALDVAGNDSIIYKALVGGHPSRAMSGPAIGSRAHMLAEAEQVRDSWLAILTNKEAVVAINAPAPLPALDVSARAGGQLAVVSHLLDCLQADAAEVGLLGAAAAAAMVRTDLLWPETSLRIRVEPDAVDVKGAASKSAQFTAQDGSDAAEQRSLPMPKTHVHGPIDASCIPCLPKVPENEREAGRMKAREGEVRMVARLKADRSSAGAGYPSSLRPQGAFSPAEEEPALLVELLACLQLTPSQASALASLRVDTGRVSARLLSSAQFVGNMVPEVSQEVTSLKRDGVFDVPHAPPTVTAASSSAASPHLFFPIIDAVAAPVLEVCDADQVAMLVEWCDRNEAAVQQRGLPQHVTGGHAGPAHPVHPPPTAAAVPSPGMTGVTHSLSHMHVGSPTLSAMQIEGQPTFSPNLLVAAQVTPAQASAILEQLVESALAAGLAPSAARASGVSMLVERLAAAAQQKAGPGSEIGLPLSPPFGSMIGMGLSQVGQASGRSSPVISQMGKKNTSHNDLARLATANAMAAQHPGLSRIPSNLALGPSATFSLTTAKTASSPKGSTSIGLGGLGIDDISASMGSGALGRSRVGGSLHSTYDPGAAAGSSVVTVPLPAPARGRNVATARSLGAAPPFASGRSLAVSQYVASATSSSVTFHSNTPVPATASILSSIQGVVKAQGAQSAAVASVLGLSARPLPVQSGVIQGGSVTGRGGGSHVHPPYVPVQTAYGNGLASVNAQATAVARRPRSRSARVRQNARLTSAAVAAAAVAGGGFAMDLDPSSAEPSPAASPETGQVFPRGLAHGNLGQQGSRSDWLHVASGAEMGVAAEGQRALATATSSTGGSGGGSAVLGPAAEAQRLMAQAMAMMEQARLLALQAQENEQAANR